MSASRKALMFVPFGLGYIFGRFTRRAEISMKSMGGGTIFYLLLLRLYGRFSMLQICGRVSYSTSLDLGAVGSTLLNFGAEKWWCTPCWGTLVECVAVTSNSCKLLRIM